MHAISAKRPSLDHTIAIDTNVRIQVKHRIGVTAAVWDSSDRTHVNVIGSATLFARKRIGSVSDIHQRVLNDELARKVKHQRSCPINKTDFIFFL